MPLAVTLPCAQAQTGCVPLKRHNSEQPPLLTAQGLVPCWRALVKIWRSFKESPAPDNSTLWSDRFDTGADKMLPRSNALQAIKQTQESTDDCLVFQPI